MVESDRLYGGHSMVAPLESVVVRRPTPDFAVADPRLWHYTARPDLEMAQREHDALVEVLESSGARVLRHDADLPGLADAVFVHDPVFVTDGGFVELRMGKSLRRGEESALGDFLEQQGVPRLGRLTGDATAESGDLAWLDARTLAIGQGFRTNRAAFEQLSQLLAPLEVECLPVHLPVMAGRDACLHLMSILSIVDERKALVYRPLLSVPFFLELVERGFELIEVPEHELATQAPNVLALAPGRLLMLEGNPETEGRLRDAGCEVTTYRGLELSLKAEGGPTCLTRPLLRRTA